MTATAPRPGQSRATAAEPRRLRIVLVEFLPSGGMFQFSFQFAAALAKAGHEVRLITGPERASGDGPASGLVVARDIGEALRLTLEG